MKAWQNDRLAMLPARTGIARVAGSIGRIERRFACLTGDKLNEVGL